MKGKRNVTIILFYGLAILLPFIPVIHSHVGGNIISLIRDGTILLIITVLIGYMFKKKIINFSIFNLFMLFWIIYGFLHVFITLTDFSSALSKFRLLYLYPILSLLVIIYFKNSHFKIDKSLYKLTNILLIQGGIIIFFSLLEIRFKDQLLLILYQDNFYTIQRDLLGQTGIRIVSLMYNPIILGLFLNILLVLFLYKNKQSGFFKFFGNNSLLKLVFISITLAIILLTYSRVSYILAAITVFVYFLINIKRLFGFRVLILILSIPLIFIANEVLLGNQMSFLDQRINQLTTEEIADNARIQNWKEYLGTISSQGELFLLWGGGLGTSNSDSDSQTEYSKRVENSYVSFFGELGLIGIIMFVIIIGRTFINLYINYRVDPLETKMIFQLLIVLVIAGITNDVFQNNPFSFYFWCLFTYLEIKRFQTNKLLRCNNATNTIS